MGEEQYTIQGHESKKIFKAFDEISLQNIGDLNYTINCDDFSMPTYVELKSGNEPYKNDHPPIKVFIRTKRKIDTSLEGHGLEPRLARVLKELGVFD